MYYFQYAAHFPESDGLLLTLPVNKMALYFVILSTQFKFTVLLMPSGPLRITGGPAFEPELYSSDKKIEDQEILDLLSQQIRCLFQEEKKECR